jgi:Outer membrane protein beta-barrel domain
MIYRKLIYLFCLFFTLNTLDAQEVTEKKWVKGFSITGCYNRMTSVGFNNLNIDFSNPFFGNQRTWKFQYQTGFSVGAFAELRLSDRFSLQGELNLLLSRQKAELEDVPIPNNSNIFGQVLLEQQTKGIVNFNNFYLQIPFILNTRIDNATFAEAGFFITSAVANNSTQDLSTTIFSEFTNNGQFITNSPPRVVKNTDKPQMYASLGWLLGIHYAINPRISARFRYEGGTLGVAHFRDLRENRMSVGVVFNMN